MTDPALTDAQRDQLFNRMNFFGGAERTFNILKQHFAPVGTDEVKVTKIFGDELDAIVTDLQLTRAHIRQGDGSGIVDTDAEGKVYLTLVDGGAGTGHVINFFNDQARTQLVANTAAFDDGQTAVLVPQAGFTLAGSVTIGVSTGANVDLSYAVVPPYFVRVDDEFDGTFTEDQDIEQQAKAAATTISSAMDSAISAIRTVAANLQQGPFARLLVAISTSTSIIEPNLSQDGVGVVTEEPIGRAEDTRRNMLGNTGGSGAISVQQQVEAGTPALISPTQGTLSAVATIDRGVAGTLTGTCNKSLDAAGPPTFSMVFEPGDTRLKTGASFTGLLPAEFDLVIGAVWKSQILGIDSFTFDYLALVTNSIGISLNTLASLWSVTGMTSGNSDAGRLHTRYDVSGVLEFFTTSAAADARDLNFLVASVAVGAAAAFTAIGGTGLTISGTTGAAVVDGDRGLVNFQPPVATPPASQFTIAMAVTVEPGLLQAAVRKGLLGGGNLLQQGGNTWRYNSSGAPNVLDAALIAGQPLQARLFGDTD